MFSSWDEQLCELVQRKKWQEIILLGSTVPIEEKSRYLWAWPTEDSLQFVSQCLNSAGVARILSIGCGSGLLEWIIQESLGIQVQGVELDNSWWKCAYSPKTFVNLSFAEPNISSDFLLKSGKTSDWNFALLFCYFNNHEAFVQYLKAYCGNYLIIIGPGNSCGRHTDPQPFEPRFEDENEWALMNSKQIENSDDFIAFYNRVRKI